MASMPGGSDAASGVGGGGGGGCSGLFCAAMTTMGGSVNGRAKLGISRIFSNARRCAHAYQQVNKYHEL